MTSPSDLINEFITDNLETIIYTNITKDGMGTGVDLIGSQRIIDETGLNVIASGGVANVEDVRAVKKAGFSGVIIGTALYEGELSLSEAISC
jgi:phosphoribosylformimino-5-aminoimidazole carboxamide ribotide isomerase